MTLKRPHPATIPVRHASHPWHDLDIGEEAPEVLHAGEHCWVGEPARGAVACARRGYGFPGARWVSHPNRPMAPQ